MLPGLPSSTGVGAGEASAELTASFLVGAFVLANDLNRFELSLLTGTGLLVVPFFAGADSGSGVAFAEFESPLLRSFAVSLVAGFFVSATALEGGAGFAGLGAAAVGGGGLRPVLRLTLPFCMIPYCFQNSRGSSFA